MHLQPRRHVAGAHRPYQQMGQDQADQDQHPGQDPGRQRLQECAPGAAAGGPQPTNPWWRPAAVFLALVVSADQRTSGSRHPVYGLVGTKRTIHMG